MQFRVLLATGRRGMSELLLKTSGGPLNPVMGNPVRALSSASGSSRRHHIQMKFATDASAPFASPMTVKKVSNTISLYSCSSVLAEPSKDVDTARPLLLLLPWLGSEPRSISRYCQLYMQHGFDVLAVESSIAHFLWPKHGLTYAVEILELLETEESLSARPLYVHAFSVGAYMFTLMLLHMRQDSERYKRTVQRIKGQVFDSLVIGSIEKMAIGVARMVSSSLFEPLVKRSVLLYFTLLKSQTVRYYKTAFNNFRQGPLTCPALFFYCEDDPLSDHMVMAQLMETWRKKGISVVGTSWKNSKHVGHLRRHPQKYQETLNNFLQQQMGGARPKSKL